MGFTQVDSAGKTIFSSESPSEKARPKGMDDRPRGALGMGDWTRFQANIRINLSVINEQAMATCLCCGIHCPPDDNLIIVGALVVSAFTDNTNMLQPEQKWRWMPSTRRGYGCSDCRERFAAAVRSTVGPISHIEGRRPFIDISDNIRDWIADNPRVREIQQEPLEVERTCDTCGQPAYGWTTAATGDDKRLIEHRWCKHHIGQVQSDIAAILTDLSGTNTMSTWRSRANMKRTAEPYIGSTRCTKCKSTQRVWFEGVCWSCHTGGK